MGPGELHSQFRIALAPLQSLVFKCTEIERETRLANVKEKFGLWAFNGLEFRTQFFFFKKNLSILAFSETKLSLIMF